LTRTIKNGVEYDREFWPESGTNISTSFPTDLNLLWHNYEDQACVFVAEALIADPPSTHITSGVDGLEIETFLWEVGGDTLVCSESLDECIVRSARNEYNFVVSQDQADEVLEQIAKLEKTEAAIKEAKKYLQDMVDAFRSTPDGKNGPT
jgi:hypothetical protein